MNDIVLEEDVTASIKPPETPEQVTQLQRDRSAVQTPKSWAGMAARSHYMTPAFSYISSGRSRDSGIPKQYPENFDHFEEF